MTFYIDKECDVEFSFDIDEIANDLVGAHFDGVGVFDDIEIYRTVTLEDVTEILNNTMRPEYAALSVINPIE